MTQNPLLKYQGKFKKKNITVKPKPIIALDTEDDSKGTPVLFCFYGDFPGGKFTTRHAEEACQFIWDVEEPSIFVCHNLEYDIANLFKDNNYLMVDKMMYASVLLKVELYGCKHIFLNSTQFFKGKLAKMAEFVGLEKLEGDALDPAYCLRDAEIVYKFTSMFQKKINEAGINLSVTIGKMCMDTYRSHHMIKGEQLTYSSPNCLKAYYGGRVEIFKAMDTKNVHVVDINSCYPYVMREYEYPDTGTIEPSSIKTHEFGIGNFTVYVPEDTFIPVLPHKSKEGRLFFPVGEFRGWWTYQEVRYAIEHGAKILKEHSGEGTNISCSPFDSFIDTFYEKRQECKTILSKNSENVEATFDSLFYKYWLNNLYGKWCQHKDGQEMSRDMWPLRKVLKAREKSKDFRCNKVGPFYNYVIPKTKLADHANFMWGIYVTSYSRIYLHKGMVSIHKLGHTLLYTDTDSIMYSPVHDKTNFSFSDKLGDWDIEKFDLGIFRQSKAYLLCNKNGKNYDIKKVACKGVPTHLAYDFIIDGMAKVMKPYRMKEALIRVNAKINAGNEEFLKEIGENIWRDVTKKMQSIYIKRRVAGNNITYPVLAESIPELETNTSIGKRSIKNELNKSKIKIKKSTHKDNFKNTRIPSGYFDTKRKTQGKPKLFVSQKIFYLREAQCAELKKGDIWFTGDVLQNRTNKYGTQLYHIFLTHFKGKKLTANFWGTISKDFFAGYGMIEDLLEKKVGISLQNNYLDDSSLELSIKVSDSKLKGQIETEIIDDEIELNEKELENLKALDWSNIICPK